MLYCSKLIRSQYRKIVEGEWATVVGEVQEELVGVGNMALVLICVARVDSYFLGRAFFTLVN
jgi:hypothetical protein